MIFERISDDIPPQMKILNMVIPILMNYCSFTSNWCIASHLMLHVTQRNVTSSNCFLHDIIQSEVVLQKQVH